MASKNNILGLDIGTNSIGWALVEYKQTDHGKRGHPSRLVDAGVRVFPEGVARTPQGGEKSKNVQRREARSARRIHKRRNSRKRDLKTLLQKSNLLPKKETDYESLMRENPYRFRKSGLDEKLALHELGRALYHFAQRRGFISNRKSEKKEDSGKVEPAISELRKNIEDSGSRTLGEYMCGKLEEGRIRGQYTHRDMYEHEFDILWKKQMEYHPKVLNDKLRIEIRKLLFFQYPYDIKVRWGKGLKKLPPRANARRAPQLGFCEYEKGKKRSPRASWYAQYFRLSQDINNLKIIDTKTGEVKELMESQRQSLIDEMGKRKEWEFDKIRKFLKLEENIRFNLEEGKSNKLKGNSTEWNLRQVFKKEYDEISSETRDEIVRQLLDVEDKSVLKRNAAEKWNLGEKTMERLLKTKLDSGYLHLSEKALKKLLPHLKDGCKYMEAVEKAGYLRRDQRIVEARKELKIEDIPDLPNPFVRAALYQVRKLINAVSREYGVPAVIRVEMARELKNNAIKRQEILKEQKENQERNEQARTRILTEFNIPDPSRDDIVKYKLWEECNHVCPYTGKPIPREALFSQDWDIEHIFPYPLSLDNSYMNKTLCWARENREKKHKKIPHEAYSADEKVWPQILHRIKSLPPAKRRRFYAKAIPDDFYNHQLTDTAYIAREARSLLEKIAGKNNVQVGKGRVTSQLRYLWGLPKKNRDDHRDHAIDAVVIALTSPEILKEMSVASAGFGLWPPEDFKAPWNGFRRDVIHRFEKIVVSHRVQRKVGGALHKDTNYGILKRKDEKNQPLYAIRKSLPALTCYEVNNRIADKKIKEIIINHLEKHGVDPNLHTEKSEIWKKAMNMPVFLPNKNGAPIPIKKVRLHIPSNTMVPLGHRAVEPGSNHHIVIFEYTAEGDKKGQWDGEVITTLEAARRIRNKKPIINTELGEGREFIMSLSENEMIHVRIGEDEKYLRVQKIDQRSKQITFRLHSSANIYDASTVLRKIPSTLKEIRAEKKKIKVTVDPLGHILEAND